MNKGELEKLIPDTKAQFIECFPASSEVINATEVFILLNRNRAQNRTKIFQHSGVTERKDAPNEGEAVIGSTHTAVIIYASVIKSAARFKRVLWHELGHVYSYYLNRELFAEAERDLNRDADTLIRNGMCVWTEYVAEVISYTVEDAPPAASAWEPLFIMENLMDEAVNSGYLAPYPLAFFNAMLFADATIIAWREANDGIVPGLNNCDDEILPLLEKLSNTLGKQLIEDNFVRISRHTLEAIGSCVDDLWDYCSVIGNFRRQLDHWIDNGILNN